MSGTKKIPTHSHHKCGDIQTISINHAFVYVMKDRYKHALAVEDVQLKDMKAHLKLLTKDQSKISYHPLVHIYYN